MITGLPREGARVWPFTRKKNQLQGTCPERGEAVETWWPFSRKRNQLHGARGQPVFGVARWKHWLVLHLAYAPLLQTMEIARAAMAIIQNSRESERVFVRYNSKWDPDTMIWGILIAGSVNEGKQTYVLTSPDVAKFYRWLSSDHVRTPEGHVAVPSKDLANHLFILTSESDTRVELPPWNIALEPLPPTPHWKNQYYE